MLYIGYGCAGDIGFFHLGVSDDDAAGLIKKTDCHDLARGHKYLAVGRNIDFLLGESCYRLGTAGVIENPEVRHYDFDQSGVGPPLIQRLGGSLYVGCAFGDAGDLAIAAYGQDARIG